MRCVHIDVGRLVVTGHSDWISLIRDESHFCLTDPLRWRAFTQRDEEHRLPRAGGRRDRDGRFSLGFDCRAQVVPSRRLKWSISGSCVGGLQLFGRSDCFDPRSPSIVGRKSCVAVQGTPDFRRTFCAFDCFDPDTAFNLKQTLRV